MSAQITLRLPVELLERLKANHAAKRQELQAKYPDYNYSLQDYIRELLDSAPVKK